MQDVRSLSDPEFATERIQKVLQDSKMKDGEYQVPDPRASVPPFLAQCPLNGRSKLQLELESKHNGRWEKPNEAPLGRIDLIDPSSQMNTDDTRDSGRLAVEVDRGLSAILNLPEYSGNICQAITRSNSKLLSKIWLALSARCDSSFARRRIIQE